MKIFCIGRNYADHAKEMNSHVPTEPMIFMKPPTALLKDNKDFYYPAFSKDIHYEVELVVRIDKNGRHIQPQFASTYYSQIGIGIDFTARDIQEQCKKKGHPWEKAKAFDHSAVLSPLIELEKFTAIDALEFGLTKNGVHVQKGITSDMIFSVNELICYISTIFTFQKGDLIYTGTPAGVGSVEIGDHLEGYLMGEKMFHCTIK